MKNTNIVYEVTAKTHLENEKIKVLGRDTAEQYAATYYECDEVYAVEIVNAFTGEIIFYKIKD